MWDINSGDFDKTLSYSHDIIENASKRKTIKKKGYKRQPYQSYPFNLNIIT
jgi:hypothetical protein